MGTYVVVTKLTPAGRKSLHANPDRLAEVNRRVERMGAKIRHQYATLGQHDFVTLLEAPDNESVARISTEIASVGTVRLTTYPTVPMDRFIAMLKLAPYRTEPHYWQTSFWARLLRRAGRYWTVTRHVRRYCHPLTIEGRENL